MRESTCRSRIPEAFLLLFPSVFSSVHLSVLCGEDFDFVFADYPEALPRSKSSTSAILSFSRFIFLANP
jgi:hypothetical protein